MKKTFLLASILLLSALSAKAEMIYSPLDWDNASNVAQSSDANQTTIAGTLSQREGYYCLIDKSGTTYRLVGVTAKLKKHVGGMIEVTGVPTSHAASNSSNTPLEIDVISFKMVKI